MFEHMEIAENIDEGLVGTSYFKKSQAGAKCDSYNSKMKNSRRLVKNIPLVSQSQKL